MAIELNLTDEELGRFESLLRYFDGAISRDDLFKRVCEAGFSEGLRAIAEQECIVYSPDSPGTTTVRDWEVPSA